MHDDDDYDDDDDDDIAGPVLRLSRPHRNGFSAIYRRILFNASGLRIIRFLRTDIPYN